ARAAAVVAGGRAPPARGDAGLRLRAGVTGRQLRGARPRNGSAGAQADRRGAGLPAGVHHARPAPAAGLRLPAPLPRQDAGGQRAEVGELSAGAALTARSTVLGWGAYLPAEVVTNDALAATLSVPAEELLARTGVARRHRAEEGMGPSGLGCEASRAALAATGLRPADIDLLGLAPMSPGRALAAAG